MSNTADYGVFVCTKIVAAKPMDKDGQEGYEVVYKDGYRSWSPKKAFEEGYINICNLGLMPAVFQGFEV